MKKILVSVSADEAQMKSAVLEAIALYRKEAVVVHLLNVQMVVPGFAAHYFSAENLHDLQVESGQQELAPAQALLDAAGVPYLADVKIGRTAETIVRVAHELGCDRIVMGQAHPVDFVEKLFGSLASQVRHLVGGAGNCSVIGA